MVVKILRRQVLSRNVGLQFGQVDSLRSIQVQSYLYWIKDFNPSFSKSEGLLGLHMLTYNKLMEQEDFGSRLK